MGVSFANCSADHLGALHDFFARVYRPDYVLRVNDALFRWQFGKLPEVGIDEYNLRIALNNREVVGCLGYIPTEFAFGRRTVGGAWLTNWIVEPNQRSFGLGPLLVNDIVRRFELTANIGPNQTARNLLTRMGWTDLGSLTRYACVLNEQATAELMGSDVLDWPKPTILKESELAPPFSVSAVDQFSEEATLLWDRFAGDKTAGTRRSREFLNWRYADHAVFNYSMFELRHDAMLKGIAIYRTERVRDYDVIVGRIAELVCDVGFERALLQATVLDARSRDVALLDFFCSSQRPSESLAGLGFRVEGMDSQIPILFQPVDRRRTSIALMAYLRNLPVDDRPGDWYATKGDGDQDRPN